MSHLVEELTDLQRELPQCPAHEIWTVSTHMALLAINNKHNFIEFI